MLDINGPAKKKKLNPLLFFVEDDISTFINRFFSDLFLIPEGSNLAVMADMDCRNLRHFYIIVVFDKTGIKYNTYIDVL